MKGISNSLRLFYFTAVLTFMQVVAFAQDAEKTTTTKVEITADTSNWFSNNWIWVVGVIVFIILLFALMGGGSSRRTTVIREDRGAGTVTRTTTVEDDL